MFGLNRRAGLALAGALLSAAPLAAADRAAAPRPAVTNSSTAPAQTADPLAPYLAREYVFVDSPPLTQYIESVLQRLIDAGGGKGRMPRVLVYSSDSFNLFTDANGLLVVSTGALREFGSEDELAAALSHELSHLLLRHPHQKESMRAFPIGVEAMESMVVAANQMEGRRRQPANDLARYGGQGLLETQTVSLLWSDILFPGFNRKQERAADEHGFVLMRAAGYDPAAFGDLFQKLAAASARRSERLEVLKKVMLERAQKAAGTGASSSAARRNASASRNNSGDVDAAQLAEEMKVSLTQGAVEGVIDSLAGLNRDYDSPDERQSLLATYAGEHPLKKAPPRPESRFKASLRQGAGQQLLAADAAGLALLAALNAGKAEAARKQSALLLPMAGKPLPSAHLNLPLGAWYERQRQRAQAEKHADAWAASPLAPSQAFLWAASQAASRRDFTGAIADLESGRRRVHSDAPFLPSLVSAARSAGNKPQAEAFTLECRAADDRNVGSRITAMLRDEGLPSGLYAECVRRLGYRPEQPKQGNPATRLTDKIREKLKRD